MKNIATILQENPDLNTFIYANFGKHKQIGHTIMSYTEILSDLDLLNDETLLGIWEQTIQILNKLDAS